MKKKLLSALLAMTLATGLFGCSSEAKEEKVPENEGEEVAQKLSAEDIKVGFLYVGPVGDEGYSYAHDQGRLALEETLGVETVYVENVPEDAEAETAMRNLIDQGCNVIYATSFGHMDWTAKVAADHPEVYFGHATGYTKLDNMSNYMGRIYEPRYLSGVAAGMNTETNKIGYVAAMPIPEVIRGINAFALGVKSVNPEAVVEVKWTNTWYDPSIEKSVAVDLINGGADVIAQHCDTTGPQIAANEAGVLAVGYNAATKNVAPEAYITAPLFNWGAYYIADVQAIVDGTWESRAFYEGLNSEIVSLDEINVDVVAEGTVEAVEAAEAAIRDGSLYVFDGPIVDNEGTERVAEGAAMTDEEILSFGFFVDNIVGTISNN